MTLFFILKFIVFITPLYLVRFKIFGIPTTPLEISIYVLFLVWLFSRPKNVFQEIDWKLWLPIGLIFFGVTLSTIFSKDIIVSAGIWKAYFLDPLLFLIVFVDIAESRRHIRGITQKDFINSVLFYFLCSGYTVAIVSVVYLLTGNLTYDGRLSAFFLSPNHLAMFLAPVLLVNIYFLLTTDLYRFRRIYTDKRIIKLLLWVSLFIVAFVSYSTQSFGAWIGLAGAILVWVLMRYKIFAYLFTKKLFIVKILIVLCVVSSLWLVVWCLPSIADYFDATGRSSLHSRIMIWESSAKMLKDNPILGIGPGMFQDYYLEYQKYFPPYLEWAVPQPHNIFLAFWLQTGIIGLIGFVWLLYSLLSLSLRGAMPRRSRATVAKRRSNLAGAKRPAHGSSLRSSHEIATSSRLTGAPPRNDIFVLVISFFVYFIIHGLVDTIYWKNDLALIFWFFAGVVFIMRIRYKEKEGEIE